MVTEHLPKDGPVLIVTASFEGQPADNAAHFVEWLENVKASDAFDGAKFGVFGCGNRDWVQTYQRVPTIIDRLLEEHGANRLVERGEGDASSPDFFEAFDEWETGVWQKLAEVCLQSKLASFKPLTDGVSRVGIRCSDNKEGYRPGREDGLDGNCARGASSSARPRVRHRDREQVIDCTWGAY